MTAKEDHKTRCGLACVIGLPNAGKSTLVNALVGSKVSIVSPKKQTTRFRVCGIVMEGSAQVVLVDTPGIFAAQKNFERTMVNVAWEALGDADVVVHIVDASGRSALEKNAELIRNMPQDRPMVLVLNKTDAANKPDLLLMAQGFNESFDYSATFMVSALKQKHVHDVVKEIVKYLPAGPYLFDPEQTTDMPIRLWAAEITREKIFLQLYQELPYSIFVETEHWENFDNGSVKIHQVVYVQKDSQKSIVLGKGGSRIKEIGQASRLEIEELTGGRVHLNLLVKVQENWQEREEYFRLFAMEKPPGK
ncbi:MAG: GTPase Era [Alphaproteobacteria bacterium]